MQEGPPRRCTTEGWNLLTDDQKDAIRAKVRTNSQDLMDKLAHLYLGRTCPITKDECAGPNCPWFLPTGDENGKITGGACVIPLIASRISPMSNALDTIADVAARSLRPVAPAGLIKPG